MDPLLSSLCQICHIDPPIYTCPRCASQTCSLKCSKRHKIWSSCDGVRDPTVYKPLSQLATPAGIDHDYNFLHSIEHKIERSEKVLIEDLEIVTRKELQSAREGEDPEEFKRRTKGREQPGAACITRVLKEKNIRLIKAPKGMRRNTENTTHWMRTPKSINWQVEWVRDGAAKRDLYLAQGHKPIGDSYEAMLEDEKKLNMTDEERRMEKLKRSRGKKAHERQTKRARLEGRQFHDLATIPILQDPETTEWSLKPGAIESEEEEETASKPKIRNYHLYLQKPLTPASFPKVLQPIDPEQHLTEILSNKDIIEFPTILVLNTPPSALPKKFMLEKDYLVAIGQGVPSSSDSKMSGTSDADSSSSSSSSSEDSDESMDEGEIDE